MDLLTVLRHLENLESKIADLYKEFSRTFSGDEEAVACFSDMSDEEIAHRDLLRYQHSLVRRNPAAFKDVEIDVNTIREATARMERMLAAPANSSLKEAVMTSIGFESDATEGYYRTAMAGSNPEVSKLLDSLCTEDRQHLAKLNEFAKSRGFLA